MAGFEQGWKFSMQYEHFSCRSRIFVPPKQRIQAAQRWQRGQYEVARPPCRTDFSEILIKPRVYTRQPTDSRLRRMVLTKTLS